MANLANAYIQIMPSMQGMAANINDVLTKGNYSKGSKAAGNSIVKGVGGVLQGASNVLGGAATAVGTAFSVKIMSGMSAGIRRADTMNAFAPMMKNLGISSEDASKSINRMSEALKGLPTPLDAGVSGVSRLVSKNGDIGKSTEMFLALNNAILAGGAPMEMQSAAIEQLTQAYAKGKPDLMEWRTLNMAMPGQLKQVASAFGMTTDELYQGLQKGKISMDDFMGKLMELNKNGTDGFASFEEQARNSTGGIQTSLANLDAAISRGWANLFNAFGAERFANIIQRLTNVIDVGFSAMVPVFERIGEAVDEFFKAFDSGAIQLTPTLKILGGALAALTLGSMGGFIAQLPVLRHLLAPLAPAIAALAGPLGLLAGAFIGVVAVSEPLQNTLKNLIPTDIPNKIQTVVDAFTNFKDDTNDGSQEIRRNVLQIAGAFGALALGATGPIGLIGGALVAMVLSTKDPLGQLEDIIGSVVTNVANVGKAVLDLVAPIGDGLASMLESAGTGIANFGDSIAPIVDTIGTGLVGALEKLQPLADPIREAFIGMGDVFNTVFTDAGPILENVANILSNVFGDAVEIAASGLQPIADALPGVVDGIKGFADGVMDFIGQVTESISQFVESPFFDTIKNAFSAAFEALGTAVGGALDALGQLGEALSPLLDVLGQVMGVLLPIVGVLAGGVIVGALAAITGVITGVGNAIQGVMTIISGLVNFVSGALNVIVGLVTGNGEQVKQGFSQMWEGVKQIFTGAINAVLGFVGGFINGVINFFGTLLAGSTEKWNAIKQAVVSKASEMATNAIQKASELVTGVIKFFSELPGKAKAQVENMARNVQSAFTNLVSKAANWGRELVGNFVNGIKSMIGAAANAAKSVAGAVAGFLKHSVPKEGPLSTELEWGVHLVNNFTDGIKKSLPKVEGAAAEIAQVTKDELDNLNANAKVDLQAQSNLTASRFGLEQAQGKMNSIIVQIDNFVNNDTNHSVDDFFQEFSQRYARQAVTLR